MANILLVRPAQTLPSPSAPDFLEKLKTLLDLREGHTKDQGSRFVTLDQLVSMGLAPKGYGPNNTYTGGATGGGSDVTPPNPPTNLQIINNFGSHTISWTNPSDKDLSHIEVWRSDTQDRGLAELVSIATNPVATVSLVGVIPNQNYYYWIRAVDTSGNYSVWCPKDQMGGHLVASDIQGAIDKLLDDLQGQITEDQLYQDLQTRIGLIDAPDSVAGSVAARIAQEASERAQAILDESSAREDAILQEATARADAFVAEALARETGLSEEANARAIAIEAERTERIAADSAEASAREALSAQVRGNYSGNNINKVTSGLLYSERTARATADTALSNRIDLIVAASSGDFQELYAAIAAEETARVSEDNALASDVSVITSRLDNLRDKSGTTTNKSLEATIVDNKTSQVTGDEALSNSIASLGSIVTNNYNTLTAALSTEESTRSSADAAESAARQALATQIRGSYTGTDVNQLTTGILYNERIARVSADNALSQSIASLQASVNSNTAAIESEQTARADADSALASDISVLQTKVDDNYAAIASEITARTNADSALSSSVTTLQTTVNGHTASIQEHTAAINGIRAEWFLKTDVNGHVSGFGLENTGATSSFIINADKFAVVKPGSPVGAASKIPFVVGTVNGTSTVGIDGQLVVDGTILARAIAASAVTADKIAAGAVTANKVAANAINGGHIAATSSIKLLEGGKLTVGNNNIVLDSETDEIIVAPDNGTVIGEPNYDGHDYCSLKDGDISFMYWNGASHQLYNSLKRVEMGMDCINGVRVTIPGIWKEQPKIIVSPASMMSYNKNYDANQTLICMAENIIKIGNSYAFTPRAYLRLTDGQVGLGINLATNVAYGGLEEDVWHYSDTSSRNTPANTTTITVSGSATTEYWVSRTWANDGHPTTSYSAERAYIRIWIVVDGAQYYVGEWSAKQVGTAGYNFTKTITGLATGVHTYYVRMGLMNSDDIHGSAGGPGKVKGSVTATREVTNQSTYQVLADGTLNYLAIGE